MEVMKQRNITGGSIPLPTDANIKLRVPASAYPNSEDNRRKTSPSPQKITDLTPDISISNLFQVGIVDEIAPGIPNGSMADSKENHNVSRYNRLLRDIKKDGTIETVNITMSIRLPNELSPTEKKSVEKAFSNIRKRLEINFKGVGVKKVDVRISATESPFSGAHQIELKRKK